MKAIKKIALLLIALLVITPVVSVQAGTMEKETSLLVDGQLNSTDWFDAEDSTYAEDGKLVLPADEYASTRVISKIIAQEDSAYKTMFSVSAKLKITQLPKDDKFIFAMGLDSIEAMSGEPRNVEVEITNSGTLRLGAYPCQIKAGTTMERCYESASISERHRHRYEFNNDYRQVLEDCGLTLSGTSPDGRLVETVELTERPFHVGVQYHPEFKSRPNRAHPLFKGFIGAALARSKGGRP